MMGSNFNSEAAPLVRTTPGEAKTRRRRRTRRRGTRPSEDHARRPRKVKSGSQENAIGKAPSPTRKETA
eukprot:137034-Pyramimonas_sp.AAC.1